MKRMFFVMLVLSLCLVCNSFAQEKNKPQNQEQPAPQREIKTIFNYKSELKLSDKQEADLKKVIADFQQYLFDKRKELDDLRASLNDLITNKANMKAIRAKLEDIAKLQVDISYTDIETARKTEDVLTASQLEKWKKIQKQARAELQAQAKEAAAKAAEEK